MVVAAGARALRPEDPRSNSLGGDIEFSATPPTFGCTMMWSIFPTSAVAAAPPTPCGHAS